jgi:nicotinate phosphoribosyltransferase
MLFPDELTAFEAWVSAMPGNSTLLVDTYDTLEGVRHAIEIGRRMRERGHRLAGIRLDSGDLAWLSIEARKLLDAAGLTDTAILASNDLDEHIIASLKDQKAAIGVWGVGTRLVTASDQPALGGVYKLSATFENGAWRPVIKLSEQTIKISTPGVLQVRRFEAPDGFVADMIYDETRGAPPLPTIVDPLDPTRRKILTERLTHRDLLVPVIRGGRCVYRAPPLSEVRSYASEQMGKLHTGIKRFLNPHRYPVGLEKGLHELKTKLTLETRKVGP